MRTVLLVHGAWHGSWCWAKVVSYLQDVGINAVAIDLPGRAGDETPVAQLTLERYARRVCHVANLQRSPVVVVGHSLGSVVITQAAEYCPESCSKLIYLCAFLPRNGQSLRDIARPGTGGLVLPNLQPDSPKGYFSFREGAPLREIFYDDCSVEDVKQAEVMLVPEAMAPMGTPVTVSAERFGAIPRAYIQCEGDRAIPWALQQEMCVASPCEEIVSMNTSHSPFLSAPRDLARIIASVSQKSDA